MKRIYTSTLVSTYLNILIQVTAPTLNTLEASPTKELRRHLDFEQTNQHISYHTYTAYILFINTLYMGHILPLSIQLWTTNFKQVVPLLDTWKFGLETLIRMYLHMETRTSVYNIFNNDHNDHNGKIIHFKNLRMFRVIIQIRRMFRVIIQMRRIFRAIIQMRRVFRAIIGMWIWLGKHTFHYE